ncbi:MAG: hypothetical protein IRY99_24825 [Isosphaeraceae bacterium]|nr:hypothetical protein [Isosphaeraceae bacterium]
MKDAIIPAVIMGMMVALAAAAETPAPLVPSPMVPVEALPPALPGLTASPGTGSKAKAENDPPPVITLRDKCDVITPRIHGAAKVEGGKIRVAASGNSLTATLTGAAYAYAYIGGHATGALSLRLVQPFDLAPGDPKTPWVALRLAAKVDGYVRSERQGTACLRVAAATLYPACGGPPWSLALPPGCAAGRCAWRYERAAELPPLIVPAGRYVLVADFVIAATVDGITKGSGEAAFSPDAPEGTWSPALNPLAGIDRKDFGFTVTLKASTP